MEIAGVITRGMDGFSAHALYFPIYSLGIKPYRFHGRGFGCFLFIPSFIMAVRLPQNRYTQRTNETDLLLLMVEIGIGVHVIVSSITFHAEAISALPWETFACSCGNIRCKNEAEESKYRNLAEFMVSYLTEILLVQADIAIFEVK
jgi:hypothetical protein